MITGETSSPEKDKALSAYIESLVRYGYRFDLHDLRFTIDADTKVIEVRPKASGSM